VTKKIVHPRNVPSKHDYYMGQAFWASSRSKDPRTQCGAVIVSDENRPLGMGYNGPPKKIDDSKMDWGRKNETKHTALDRAGKYPLIKHAEENAIKYSSECLSGATLYVTGPPCSNCMLSIVDEEISKVIYFPYLSSDSGSMLADSDDWEICQDIARLGHVGIVAFEGNLNWMRDQMEMFNNMGIFKSLKN
jgi:dCMP deaminase